MVLITPPLNEDARFDHNCSLTGEFNLIGTAVLGWPLMPQTGFDLSAAAHQEMIDQGFDPDFPSEVARQVAALKTQKPLTPDATVRDLRSLLWSSIDNDTSRDLDQAEAAERVSAEDGKPRFVAGAIGPTNRTSTSLSSSIASSSER